MVSESPGPGSRVPWRPRDEALRVNVGGVRRLLSARALARFPGTRLGRLQAAASEEQARRLCDDYDAVAREFYFDRHPGFFLGLLHFYRTGHLHVLDELCVFAFGQEADYWGLGENALATCCRARYLERRVTRPRAWDEDSDAPSSVDPCPDEISDVQRELARYGAARCGRLRRRLWLTMENPGYSLPSKLFSCVSIGVVLASIAAMCIHSLPEYQAREAAAAVAAVAAGRSAEDVRDDPVLRRLEYFCIAWFSFEVSSRLLLAPSTRNFFCHPLNLIDIVSVLPFYLTLLAGAALGDRRGASGEELGDLGKVVQVFRLMRIFRVLKLARHSTGLRSLGATLKHSYREVGILLLYLAVGVSVFSGVAYTAEEENVGFDTIPACWWWGTVSMTTVGYGDVVPETVAGKLAASGCILGGILVVALPITIIFNKFSHFYRRQKALEAAVRSSGQRSFEDLLSSVDGVSEVSLETSRETSQEGQSTDLETQAPCEPAKPQSY
ncbi:potassium voltage-gated channel subfamily S member 1 [Onychomys torridus]|uniref:potassium voltage-gated channel subfamily S member 1 n=1 Tax=Onychomys torridus TaxID=38674 RepID=UPI00167F3F79|nr:potassium voltage-gated channel subfamily S member 1 [Onychomys torridus]XP_036040945.1 potassium voltage-gated channel subfamily S member 1 [Onychomys torridus]XP_036040946.1 potassium voltage-gated channel subfamily S member 1 [Onychomys torridus]XP_036040947.1 potassium voltage-gated channel subfamily S member 1 [Onychomys torridus]XP_036040948.1 potassium voltage-gated channel subfamily S member 1 [Onychomys torridus]